MSKPPKDRSRSFFPITEVISACKLPVSSNAIRNLFYIVPEFIQLYDPPQLLGEGGMGRVQRARYHGHDVAAKSFDFVEQFLDEDSSSRLTSQEFVLQFTLIHPTILRPFGYTLLAPPRTTSKEQVYLITEFLEQGSLKDHIERQDHNDSQDTLLRWASQLASALAFLHALRPALSGTWLPVTHNDIKLSNILIRGKDVVLADFGCAMVMPMTRGDPPLGIGGTASYLSPEAITGRKDVKGLVCFPRSRAADVWALGAVFHALLRRVPYYTGPGMGLGEVARRMGAGDFPVVTERERAVCPALADVVTDMLKPDVSARLNAEQVLDHLVEARKRQTSKPRMGTSSMRLELSIPDLCMVAEELSLESTVTCGDTLGGEISEPDRHRISEDTAFPAPGRGKHSPSETPPVLRHNSSDATSPSGSPFASLTSIFKWGGTSPKEKDTAFVSPPGTVFVDASDHGLKLEQKNWVSRRLRSSDDERVEVLRSMLTFIREKGEPAAISLITSRVPDKMAKHLFRKEGRRAQTLGVEVLETVLNLTKDPEPLMPAIDQALSLLHRCSSTTVNFEERLGSLVHGFAYHSQLAVCAQFLLPMAQKHLLPHVQEHRGCPVLPHICTAVYTLIVSRVKEGDAVLKYAQTTPLPGLKLLAATMFRGAVAHPRTDRGADGTLYALLAGCQLLYYIMRRESTGTSLAVGEWEQFALLNAQRATAALLNASDRGSMPTEMVNCRQHVVRTFMEAARMCGTMRGKIVELLRQISS